MTETDRPDDDGHDGDDGGTTGDPGVPEVVRPSEVTAGTPPPDTPPADIPGDGPAEAADPLAALTGGGGLDLGAMMQMAEEMTTKMGEARSELAETVVEGTSGGGLVTVELNGHLHMVGLRIDPAAFDPDDPSILEDLVLAAWKDAHDDVAKLQAAADPLAGLGGLGGGTGGLGGLFGS